MSTTLKYIPPHKRNQIQEPHQRRFNNRFDSVVGIRRYHDRSNDEYGTTTRHHHHSSQRRQPSFQNFRRSLVGRQQQRQQPQPPKPQQPKILFFGDSFVKLFGLLKHPHMEVHGFKGATAKGLTRQDNENRQTILGHIRDCCGNLDRIIFCFGSVDVHFSYFHTKYAAKQQQPNPTTTPSSVIDLNAVAKDYVDFIASLFPQQQQGGGTSSKRRPLIHVLGVYPNPLKPENVGKALAKYGVIPEEVIPNLSPEDISTKGRQQRVCQFNEALKMACDKHQGLVFESVYDKVFDPTTNLVKPCFQDIADQNIHLVWETTIQLWLNRWEWLQELANSDLAFGSLQVNNLQQTLQNYVRNKPWANQQHVIHYGLDITPVVIKKNNNNTRRHPSTATTTTASSSLSPTGGSSSTTTTTSLPPPKRFE